MTGDRQMSGAERAVDALLEDAHLAAPHQLAGLVARHAATLGADHAVVYLVDLQQRVLVPFLDPDGPGVGRQVEPLSVDATLPGRAFQHVEVLTQDAADGRSRVWLPLLDGIERLGVLGVTVDAAVAPEVGGGLIGLRLRRFAALVAELIMTKTMYGDTIVRLRRQAEMGLGAEMQWSLLPPLTFACHEVTVARLWSRHMRSRATRSTTPWTLAGRGLPSSTAWATAWAAPSSRPWPSRRTGTRVAPTDR